MIKIIRDISQQKKISTFLNPFSYVLARKNQAQLAAINIEIDGGGIGAIVEFIWV